MLEAEKRIAMTCDGLISRFLIATPKPIALELQKELPKWEGLKLKHLILGVYTINRNLVKSNSLDDEKLFLKFNDSSFIILKDKFHEYDVISQKYAIENPLIWYSLTFKIKSLISLLNV
jgi:hypothetical protein